MLKIIKILLILNLNYFFLNYFLKTKFKFLQYIFKDLCINCKYYAQSLLSLQIKVVMFFFPKKRLIFFIIVDFYFMIFNIFKTKLSQMIFIHSNLSNIGFI